MVKEINMSHPEQPNDPAVQEALAQWREKMAEPDRIAQEATQAAAARGAQYFPSREGHSMFYAEVFRNPDPFFMKAVMSGIGLEGLPPELDD